MCYWRKVNASKALSNPHLHTYNYSYENCNQEEYHNAYCSCGDMILQSHTWTSVNINPQKTNNVLPNYIPAYKCRSCQYISYIGPGL